jgi:glutamine synthetase
MGDSIEALLFKLIDKEPAKPLKAGSEFLQTDKLSFVPKDNTDRNRTSPFAFTGNKFELRMLGSSLSPAKADTIIATILADSLREIADRLEPIASVKTVREEALKIITEIIHDHHRILFSGDGYSSDWVVEAKKRGLPNIPSFVESISSLLEDKAVSMFERNGVYTHAELEARSEILYELYSKTILAEARTLIEMTEREISAAIFEYAQGLTALSLYPSYKRKLDEIVALDEILAADLYTLKATLTKIADLDDAKATGLALREKVVGLLEKVRKDADVIETKLPSKTYPFPSYLDLLFLRD